MFGATNGIRLSRVYRELVYDVGREDGETADYNAGTGDLFEKHDFNAFPVLKDGEMMGIVSKFDFLRAFAFTSSQIVPHYVELMNRVVADVMTEAIVHVDRTSPLTRVLELMVSLKTRSFPVLNADRQLQGIISREDIMRALRETARQEASK